jgi:fructose-bisphosphate aldolase, class I
MAVCLCDPRLLRRNPYSGPFHLSAFFPHPSQLAVLENSTTLARFATISQSHGLVPIVEPEVLMDGDFAPEVAGRVTERILAAVVKALADHHVFLEGVILKPNMVRSGSDSTRQAESREIGDRTLVALQRTIPVALPGIAFLSGGLSEEMASLALCAINNAPGAKPW